MAGRISFLAIQVRRFDISERLSCLVFIGNGHSEILDLLAAFSEAKSSIKPPIGPICLSSFVVLHLQHFV
jgi:hypothetical protein